MAEAKLLASVLDGSDVDTQLSEATQQLLDLGFEYQTVPCEKHQEGEDEGSNIIADGSRCFACQTRLFHIHPRTTTATTMISPDNQAQFVPKGPKFQSVSSICQTIVQCRLIKRYNLQRMQLCTGDNDDDDQAIEALVTPNYFTDPHSPTLIIIPGKGDSRAGILSTKQMVLSGMEAGSTGFFLEQAGGTGMAVVLLDPNARGPQSGMTCLDLSLTKLFEKDDNQRRRPLYILAHSAAGGYLVRYLLLGQCRTTLTRNLQAICFTDSTHNIQWAKPRQDENGETHGDKALFDFLQSSQCIYVRNTATHHLDTFASSKNRKLGDTIPQDVHWERRFGKIRTVWAGTTEHSRICWEGRHIIWDFFLRAASRDEASA